MVNPVSSANISHANEAAKTAAPKTQQTQQNSTPQPSDTVKLKSVSDVDHDGDSH
jgi:hypothetical protein